MNLFAFYECNICGEEHPLRVAWTEDAEIGLKEEWKLDMISELVSEVIKQAKDCFKAQHPNRIFDIKRLIFSQVFD